MWYWINVGWINVGWINVVLDIMGWRTFVNIVMNIRVE